MKKLLNSLKYIFIGVLLSGSLAYSATTDTNWFKNAPDSLATNTGNGLANADIHVRACYIGLGTGTPCGGGGGGTVTGADNGLHLDGTDVFLGGTFVEDTEIDIDGFNLIIEDASLSSKIDMNVNNGPGSISIVGGHDPNTGHGSDLLLDAGIYFGSGDLDGGSVLIHSEPAGGAGTPGNIDLQVEGGGNAIITCQAQDCGFWIESTLATADNGDVWTLVDDTTGEGEWAPAAGGLVTADNGLSISGGDNVQLGGSLIQDTTIVGSGTFDMNFTEVDAFRVSAGTNIEFVATNILATLQNDATQDRLVGMTNSSTELGILTVGPGLSLSGGVLDLSSSGATIPINNLLAATDTNSINNGDLNQNWAWNTLTEGAGLTISSNSTTASGDDQNLFQVLVAGTNATSQITTAATIQNAHAGTASTNIGLRLTATNGTNNYALIVSAGNGKIGFGLSAPTANVLHVAVPNVTTESTTTSGIVEEAPSLTSGTLHYIYSTSTAAATGSELLDLSYSGANSSTGVTATGARISVTKTNVTSGTNVGLEVTASGATTNNFAIQTAGTVAPIANDGSALGTGTLSFADLFLASGGVLSFNNGNTSITHSTNTMTFVGAWNSTNGSITLTNGSVLAQNVRTNPGGILGSSSTDANANLLVFGTSASTSSATEYLFTGASTVSFRIGNRGSTNYAIPSANSYANHVMATQAVTEFSSGTHALIAGEVLKAPAITAGAASVTNTATLYLEDAPNASGANNYTLWSDAGVNRFDGEVDLNSDIKLLTAGNGVYIKEGTNATMGVATLVGGTVVVNTTKVTANSRIFLTAQSLGTVTVGQGLAVSARTAGTSFTILSGSALDTSTVAWIIYEPSP